ncbi:MAG TPA: hypothetical protein PKL15_00435 [Saprospiraceae bacterium]|nr:hypothetical protein [Saprospiraceae bacterium]
MGYLSFALTLFFYIGLILINIYLSKPHRGENAMGLGMILSVVGIGFTICSLILTFSIGSKGGFDWVSPQGRTRNLWIWAGWLFMMVAVFDSSFFESGWYHDFPDFLRRLVKSIEQMWIPILIFVAYFIFLNTELNTRVSSNTYKTTLTIAFGLAALMVLGIIFGWMRQQIVHKIAVDQAKTEEVLKYGADRSWYFKNSMDYINAHNEKTITRLLSYTVKDKDRDENENEIIRNAAVAKIKSYEQWETDVIHILEGKEEGSIYEAYGFLDGNKVEHPDNFIIPIKNSIARVTTIAQKSINDPDDLYLGSTNIVSLCHILDAQFKDSAAEFRPNMVRLQQVLDTTPAKRSDKKYAEGFDEILQKSRLAVNNWLAANQ